MRRGHMGKGRESLLLSVTMPSRRYRAYIERSLTGNFNVMVRKAVTFLGFACGRVQESYLLSMMRPLSRLTDLKIFDV